MTGFKDNEFSRGWQVLLGAFIGIATGASSLYFYSLGLFLKPMAEAFGWNRGAASLGPLVGTLGAAFAATPTGWLMDRIGPTRTALGALIMLAAAFASLALLTRGLASFLILSAVLSLVTVGSTPLTYSRLVVAGFDRHRGLALGLSLTATGIGAGLMPVLLSPYIATHGWRSGYMALAAISLVAFLPVALLLQGRGNALTKRRTAAPLSVVIADPAFRMLGPIFFLAATGVLGAVVHFPAMLSDAGLSAARAGTFAGLVGVAVIAGRGVAGLLLDHFPARFVTASFFGISGLGLLMLAMGGATLAAPGALALGISVGAEVDLVAYLVSRLFPRPVYGTAYGSIYSLFLLGGATGPAIIGVLFDQTGSYRTPLLFAAFCLAGAALLTLRIGRLPMIAEEDAMNV